MSTAANIRKHVESLLLGEPFSGASMLRYGTRAAVHQALSRLARAKTIRRVTHGVYVRPEVSPYVGEVMPAPFKVAKVIAEESGGAVQVHGAEAARRFSLTTQVPAKPVFLTSGPNRSFRMGKLMVTLKKVSSNRLALAGRPAGMAITALRYVGEEHVTQEVLETIETALGQEEFGALVAERSVMPAWMAEKILHYGRRTQ